MRARVRIGLLFACCWGTYLTAYLCRVNFSSAMDKMQRLQGIDAEKLGLVGTLFYAVYAAGQLVNGFIGDRVPSNRFVMVSLGGTITCNALMSFVPSLSVMYVVWGLNGFFQSVFWSTLVRLLANHSQKEKRASVSSGLSLAMPAAYLVSWGILGKCLENADIKLYFLIPCIAALFMLCAWFGLSKRYDLTLHAAKNVPIRETVRQIRRGSAGYMLPVCFFHGLIKEGIGYWLPLFLQSYTGIEGVSPFLLLSAMPIMNTIGILLSKKTLRKNRENTAKTLLFFFFAITVLATAVLLFGFSPAVAVIMLLISGLCYANNNVLMGFYPMRFAEKGITASVAGMFDCASYAGAAISTYALGSILKNAGFAPIPLIWLAASVLAGVVSAGIFLYEKKKNPEQASV